MSRYFSAPRSRDRSYFDDQYPDQIVVADVQVPEHRPVDTGLVDVRGHTIWRAPNPMGFGRDDEW